MICDKMSESLDGDPNINSSKGTRLTDTAQPSNVNCNCQEGRMQSYHEEIIGQNWEFCLIQLCINRINCKVKMMEFLNLDFFNKIPVNKKLSCEQNSRLCDGKRVSEKKVKFFSYFFMILYNILFSGVLLFQQLPIFLFPTFMVFSWRHQIASGKEPSRFNQS